MHPHPPAPTRLPMGLPLRLLLRLAGSLALAAGLACGTPNDFAPRGMVQVRAEIQPSPATVAAGRSLSFKLVGTHPSYQDYSAGATWSVNEPGGGTIAPGGLYTAPASPGTFHVLATLPGAFPAQAEVTVTGAPASPMAIQAPATLAVQGTAVAILSNPEGGAAYRWSITGGAFLGADSHPTSVQAPFTATRPGELTLLCEKLSADLTTVLDKASTTVAVTAPPVGAEPLALDGPAWVTSGVPGATATVVNAGNGRTYTWTLEGGTFTGSASGPAVTFTPGAGPAVTLTCTASFPGAAPIVRTLAVAVAPPPGVPAITAPASLPVGTLAEARVAQGAPGMSYDWTIQGGTFAGLSQGTPTVVFMAGAPGTVTLTCTARNAAGTLSPPGQATTAALPAAVDAPTLVAPTWATAHATGLVATIAAPQAGLRYRWSITGGTFAGDTQTPEGASVSFQAGAGPAVQLQASAVDAAGTLGSPGAASVAIAPVPGIPVISALPAALENTTQAAWAQGQPGETFHWTITGGAFLGPDPTPEGRSVAFTAGSAGALILTCRARNAAGEDSAPGFFSQAVQASSGQPNIQAPASAARGALGLVAQVLGPQPGLIYDWTIQGGQFQGPAQGSSVTFTAGNGFGLFLTCTASTPAGTPSAPALAGVALEAPPPQLQIQALPAATAGSPQVASILGGIPGIQYQWRVQGGTLTGDPATATSPTITYVAGGPGPLTLSCVATLGLQILPVAPFQQTVTAPSTVRIVPSAPTVTAGSTVTASVDPPAAGTTYLWTVQGGAFTSGAPTATGVTVSVIAGPTAPGTGLVLACTATDGAGSTATARASLAILDAPAPPALDVPALYTAGAGPVHLAVANPVAGLRYAWQAQGGTFTGGSDQAVGTDVDLDGNSLGPVGLTCQAQNLAGASSNSIPASTTGLPPSSLPTVNLARIWTAGQAGLQATETTPAGGALTTCRWTIQGGAFADGSTTAQGTSVTLDTALAGPRMLLCEALNGAQTASQPVLAFVDIVPPPVAASLANTGAPTIYAGGLATLTATFTGGTGRVDPLPGPVLSGVPFQVQVQASQNFTLTVTNPAATRDTRVLAVPVQVVPTTIDTFGTRGAQVTDFGTPFRLDWTLQGVPQSLTLSTLQDPLNVKDVLAETFELVQPKRRQTYVLDARDPLGASRATSEVATRGLDLLAGNRATQANFWGGAAEDAAWRSLTGLAADTLGNVYFSEGEDQTLRRIAPDGTVSVLAGLRADPDDPGAVKPKGRLFNPVGISVTPGGSLLVADQGTHTLKIIGQDGSIAVFAGTPNAPGAADGPPYTGRLDSPRYLATHRATGISMISEKNTDRLILADDQGRLTEFIGHGVQSPSGLAFDPAGNVYVLSRATGDLFKFAPDRPLDQAPAWAKSTLASGFTAPEGLAYATLPDGTPYLAVADTGTHRIIGVSLATGARRAIAGAAHQSGDADGPGLTARFDGPTAITQGANGTLYVVDQEDGYALRTIAPDGTVATLGHGNDDPKALGNVDGQGEAARFFLPLGIAVDSHGSAYVADANANTIRRIEPDGTVTTVAGTPARQGSTDGDGLAQALFANPQELALDARDVLYISEPAQNRIRTYDPATGQVATFINAGLSSPGALTFDADGNLLVADRGTQRILAVDPHGVLQAAPVAQGIDAAGLATGGDGSVYATIPSRQAIQKLAPPALAGAPWTGSWLVLGDRGALDSIGDEAPEFNGPWGITLGPGGNLYVADTFNGLIRRVDPDGKVTTLAGSYPDLGPGLGLLPGTLPQVSRIAVTPQGDLLVTAGSAVYQITAP